jgi:hypothetical protein
MTATHDFESRGIAVTSKNQQKVSASLAYSLSMIAGVCR